MTEEFRRHEFKEGGYVDIAKNEDTYVLVVEDHTGKFVIVHMTDDEFRDKFSPLFKDV